MWSMVFSPIFSQLNNTDRVALSLASLPPIDMIARSVSCLSLCLPQLEWCGQFSHAGQSLSLNLSGVVSVHAGQVSINLSAAISVHAGQSVSLNLSGAVSISCWPVCLPQLEWCSKCIPAYLSWQTGLLLQPSIFAVASQKPRFLSVTPETPSNPNGGGGGRKSGGCLPLPLHFPHWGGRGNIDVGQPIFRPMMQQ